MVNRGEFLAAVDIFMAAKKHAIGVATPQTWREGRALGEGELQLKFPIEVNGEQDERHKLIIAAFPDSDELKFTIGLVFQWAVFRLDYEIGRIHTNQSRMYGSSLPRFVKGPHYHPWVENRATISDVTEAFRLPIALPLDSHIRQFDQALRWFCQQVNIELRNHEIELPPRERLL